MLLPVFLSTCVVILFFEFYSNFVFNLGVSAYKIFREFFEINMRNPAPSPPRLPFSNTAGVNLHFDEEATILYYFEYFFFTVIFD